MANNYTLRIPDDLREHLQEIADKEGRSLSNLIIFILRNGVDNYRKEK